MLFYKKRVNMLSACELLFSAENSQSFREAGGLAKKGMWVLRTSPTGYSFKGIKSYLKRGKDEKKIFYAN